MIRIAIAIITCALLVVGCARPQLGPFVDAHAKPCQADPDCPVHQICKFWRQDTPPVCMAGTSEFDQAPAPQ